MKVFLSWSGKRSHRVACILRDWLPSVIQSVEPYVSSEDIDKGARWSTDIARELDESSYGLISVTKENLATPWVNFEAGALSKSLDKANVTPLLIDIKRLEVQGPLLQFQSVIIDRDEINKLLRSINFKIVEQTRLRDSLLEKAYEVWWPQLEKQLKEVANSEFELVGLNTDPDEKTKILEELLELSRQQQKILNNPEVLLPPKYLDTVIGTMSNRTTEREFILHRDLREMHETFIFLDKQLQKMALERPELGQLATFASGLHNQFHQLDYGSRNKRKFYSQRLIEEEKKSQ